MTTATPKHAERFLHQPRKRGVIGRMQAQDLSSASRGIELCAIDLGAVAHDARNDAEPRIHARIRRIDSKAERAVEHRRHRVPAARD